MDLLVEVPRQEPEALARLHRRPRQDDARHVATHEGVDGHRHREERLAGPGGADAEHHVVLVDGVDVPLLAHGLGRDPLLAGRHRDGVGEDRLDVGVLVAGEHPGGRAHFHGPHGRAGPHQLGQLGQGALGLLHLALAALQHHVVAARDDADFELGFERAEMVVVPPEQLRQVDVRRQRQAARDDGRVAQTIVPWAQSTTRAQPLPGPAGGRSSLMCSSLSRSGGTGAGACIRRSCAC